METGTYGRIHMGHIVEARVRSHGVSVGWLARQISCTRNNIYGIFSRASLDSDLLFRLSAALDYDFFAVLSRCLKEEASAGSSWNAQK